MRYELAVKEEALQDMSEAFAWYEEKRSNLGAEFLNEVEQYFEKISTNPRHYQQQGQEHVAVLKRFPYKIVYEIENESIVVYAIFHTKRNPKKMKDRN